MLNVLNIRKFRKKVDEDGAEPDPRFTLANERTFLAWIRTGVALLVTGMALEAIPSDFLPDLTKKILVLAVIGMSIAVALFGGFRWKSVQRALRVKSILPNPSLVPVLTLGTALIAAVIFGFLSWS